MLKWSAKRKDTTPREVSNETIEEVFETSPITHSLWDHIGGVKTLCFQLTERVLVSGSCDSTIMIFKCQTPLRNVLTKLSRNRDTFISFPRIRAVSWSITSRIPMVNGRRQILSIILDRWFPQSRTFRYDQEPLTGEYMLAAVQDHVVRLYDVNTAQCSVSSMRCSVSSEAISTKASLTWWIGRWTAERTPLVRPADPSRSLTVFRTSACAVSYRRTGTLASAHGRSYIRPLLFHAQLYRWTNRRRTSQSDSPRLKVAFDYKNCSISPTHTFHRARDAFTRVVSGKRGTRGRRWAFSNGNLTERWFNHLYSRQSRE